MCACYTTAYAHNTDTTHTSTVVQKGTSRLTALAPLRKSRQLHPESTCACAGGEEGWRSGRPISQPDPRQQGCSSCTGRLWAGHSHLLARASFSSHGWGSSAQLTSAGQVKHCMQLQSQALLSSRSFPTPDVLGIRTVLFICQRHKLGQLQFLFCCQGARCQLGSAKELLKGPALPAPELSVQAVQ